MAAHEKGGIPCRTRYDASQGDWLRQSGPGAAAIVLDPFPKVAVCIVFYNGCKAMVFTVQPCESESKVINERFASSPRRSCLDTAWPPILFNYTYGADRLNPETAEHYEHMKTVV